MDTVSYSPQVGRSAVPFICRSTSVAPKCSANANARANAGSEREEWIGARIRLNWFMLST